MRVGFLFNHDQIHQVAHSLPIAMALARGGFAGEIIVATSNSRMADEVRRIGGDLIGTRIQHVELGLSGVSRLLSGMLGKVVPASKVLIYRDNLDFFRSLDVLVVAEKTSLLLKTHYGLSALKIVHTRHGAGDRAIGFDPASAGFDHVLCSGPKIRRRLIEEAGLDRAKVTIVGYPKFDLLPEGSRDARPPHQPPITLYNPHPSPHLSSWYKDGRAILDYYLGHADQELIFAPHVMLFERKFVVTIDKMRIDRPGRIDDKFRQAPNIKIDTGSRASTDMSYTLAADIYLGDASSQVYEFLLRPRPCIFVNSHGFDWQNDPNFLHWHAGEVITAPDQLPGALERAQSLHDSRYRAVQQALFADSFDITDRPSSDRGAEVIARLAERG
ncbi:MAG: hypothetical protein E2598_03605 [Sphingobium sp.]|nr:hypothetical protein [Sphingobium sp.]